MKITDRKLKYVSGNISDLKQKSPCKMTFNKEPGSYLFFFDNQIQK
jgi:hypothetical protein